LSLKTRSLFLLLFLLSYFYLVIFTVIFIFIAEKEEGEISEESDDGNSEVTEMETGNVSDTEREFPDVIAGKDLDTVVAVVADEDVNLVAGNVLEETEKVTDDEIRNVPDDVIASKDSDTVAVVAADEDNLVAGNVLEENATNDEIGNGMDTERDFSDGIASKDSVTIAFVADDDHLAENVLAEMEKATHKKDEPGGKNPDTEPEVVSDSDSTESDMVITGTVPDNPTMESSSQEFNQDGNKHIYLHLHELFILFLKIEFQLLLSNNYYHNSIFPHCSRCC
jgi:hypothetical protein